MYQTLYRKYRSQTFGEMVGQVISTTSRQAVESGKSAMPISFLVHVVPVKPVRLKNLCQDYELSNQVAGEPCNRDICRVQTEVSTKMWLKLCRKQRC